ncbi:helix-turn-helix domain-containing protein [Acrocarpospora sp. B8E8]|uniref:helix-turn-helix domain-containing protein n=1 Tax=Acrocarpospora sp. B8E8 TaxID=3153572 RepID=UPI00325D7328
MSGWIEDEELWTAEELAALVGVKVRTVYSWMQRGYLRPAGSRGRFWLFRLEDGFTVEKERKRQHRRAA